MLSIYAVLPRNSFGYEMVQIDATPQLMLAAAAYRRMWRDAARRPEGDVNKWVSRLNWLRGRCLEADFFAMKSPKETGVVVPND